MKHRRISIRKMDNCPHCQEIVHFEDSVVVEEAVFGKTDKLRMSAKHGFVLRHADVSSGPVFGCLACPVCKRIVLIQLDGTRIWP